MAGPDDERMSPWLALLLGLTIGLAIGYYMGRDDCAADHRAKAVTSCLQRFP